MQPSKMLRWLLVPAVMVMAGCSQQKPPMQMPPPEVGVVKVSTQSMPVITELPGRINAERVAEVRARVTGIVLKRLFTEGSEVKEGDQLFQIDPAPLQAAYDSAKATLIQTQAKASRYKALVDINAVSKQDYDDALAASLQAKAAFETASLNLGYANVTAPISGKIGEAKVTEGALVSQSDATQMALIQQMDPIYFDFTEASTDVLKLRDSFDKGQLQKVDNDNAKVTLLLDDGTEYPTPGKLLFTDITVDPSTGMVTLRAEFSNPDHILLPGMFARVQLEQAVNQNAITVPQRAAAIKGDGTATVMVVKPDNTVDARTIKLGDAQGDQWIVTDGLKAGETVIVDGLQKVRPGAPVKPVPFTPESN